MLTQTGRPWEYPMVRVCKYLDPVNKGCLPHLPSCSNSYCSSDQKTGKLTLGQTLNCPGTTCCTGPTHAKLLAWFFQYSPAMYWPTKLGPPYHDCLALIGECWWCWQDLKLNYLTDAENILFMGESSPVRNGVQQARYAVVTLCTFILAKALSHIWSAQQTVAVSCCCFLLLSAKNVKLGLKTTQTRVLSPLWGSDWLNHQP